MKDEKVFEELIDDEISDNISDEKTEINDDKINSEDNYSEKKKISKNFIKELYEWTQAIAIAVVIALFINHFVFSIVEVQGDSMRPTLHQSERLFVFKTFYQPKNKDIVIVKSEQLGKYIVKRVIAVGGQTIDIDKETGAVYVDGELQDEPYINEDTNYYVGNIEAYPLTIPDDCVFVMGDNRGNSMDSRALGFIENDDIMGKAVFRIWPFNNFGGLYSDLK